MATCVDLAGAAYPKEFAGKPITPLEGRSLLPAFDGKPIERDAIFWEHEGNRAVRQGDWKLVAKAPAGRVGAVQHGRRPHGDARPGHAASRTGRRTWPRSGKHGPSGRT